MKYIRKKDVLPAIHLALKEDIGSGDVTGMATVDPSKRVSTQIVSKDRGILAGLSVSRWVFLEVDSSLKVSNILSEGDRITKGIIVQKIEGNARSILKAERTALNFLSRISGIATMTAQAVEAVGKGRSKVIDTRKTAPCLRYIDKYAVRIGGGTNHRMGLWDMVLIKENHIEAAGGIGPAVSHVREMFKKKGKKLTIEVEAKNLEEVREAAELKVDRIMLDNMTVLTMIEAVNIIRSIGEKTGKNIESEASGGITLNNINHIAETGIDYISIGSLTHSVKAFDFSLIFSHE